MKHPIYAILLATLISFTFLTEHSTEPNNIVFEKNNNLSAFPKPEHRSISKTLIFETDEKPETDTVTSEKNSQLSEEIIQINN